VEVTAEKPSRLEWATGLLDDPILLKELRAAFRRARFFRLQTALLALVAIVVIGTMWKLTDEFSKTPSEIGRRTFLIFGSIEIGLIFLVFPAFACTSITEERTNKSLDLLLATDLSPSRIVIGKMLASFVYGLQFIVATLPVVALTFLYGGVTPGQIVITYAVMTLLAALVTIHALAVSSGAGSTLRAVLLTYVGLILIIVPLAAPLVVTPPLGLFSSDGGGNGPLSGILAVHVYGPLMKDPALLKVRDEVRDYDAVAAILYWGGHALFYASAVSLLFLFARHRLAPNAANRSTPLKAWFLATFGLALAGTLAGVHHFGLGAWAVEVLGFVELAAFIVLSGAAIAFAGEDPLMPRRLRAPFEATRGLRAPLGMLYPGGANGVRFVFWVAFATHAAIFLAFQIELGSGNFVPEHDYRPAETILHWSSAWSFLFIVFVAQLSYILSCELRHELAGRACSAIAIVAIALGPLLWCVLERTQSKPYPYKGYWASPVTVALSIFEEPIKIADRQLLVFSPSGDEANSAKAAVQKTLSDLVSGPPGERPPGDPVQLTREALEKQGVDATAIDFAAAAVKATLPLIPADPGTLSASEADAIKKKGDDLLESDLRACGVPVHEVSAAAYLALVVILALVTRRRYAVAALAAPPGERDSS
jgi:ABC-type transport system involved in multi-copper enzyme maturation permease subunit